MNKVLDYYYYKNLGFNNFESWSEEDLSQFLVWDLLNACSNTIVCKDFKSYIEDHNFIVEKHNKIQTIFNFLDRFFFIFDLTRFSKNKHDSKGAPKKILFENSNYSSIISGARKKYFIGVVSQGKRDILFMRKDFFGSLGINDLDRYFFLYLKDRNIKHLRQLIKIIENKLKIIKPDYIVLGNDTGPVERAIVLASKKMGIITMEIQHGVYMKSSADGNAMAEPLADGKVADYVLVWGKYFKDLYIEQKIRSPEDIYILGYPYLIGENISVKKQKNVYTVCFLAQGFEKYNRDFFQIKLESVKQVSEICKKLGFKFIYRYHPRGEDRETIAKNLPGIEFTRKKEKIKETFKRADIFISFSSTALVEAAMKQKIALQLMNYPIRLDNFEKLGACSKSLENFTQLEDYLTKIANAPNLDDFKTRFNNDYVETRGNPGQRFLEIMEKISLR